MRRKLLAVVSRKGCFRLGRALARTRDPERAIPGRFQPYSHTLPDRYPWLFQFAKNYLGGIPQPRILSFGCSRGEEVFALREYFPAAAMRGIDIDPRNIDRCLARVRTLAAAEMTFSVAATTAAERTESFNAIFCLAVLCHGDLAASGAKRCDPLLHFENFDRVVTDFARCLKPGGLLLLHTTNFRFCDTAVYQSFETVLEADPGQLAPDPIFDRDDRLMAGVRYRAVAFRKRAATPTAASSAAAAS